MTLCVQSLGTIGSPSRWLRHRSGSRHEWSPDTPDIRSHSFHGTKHKTPECWWLPCGVETAQKIIPATNVARTPATGIPQMKYLRQTGFLSSARRSGSCVPSVLAPYVFTTGGPLISSLGEHRRILGIRPHPASSRPSNPDTPSRGRAKDVSALPMLFHITSGDVVGTVVDVELSGRSVEPLHTRLLFECVRIEDHDFTVGLFGRCPVPFRNPDSLPSLLNSIWTATLPSSS